MIENNRKPVVTVIIPTANRPNYLPRAINSAIEGIDLSEIEVIVVPNGPDKSWNKTLKQFKTNTSIKIIPLQEGNANIARNLGLANAKGKFVRFLDDDDFLIPKGVIEQYKIIKDYDADIVSGCIKLVDESGKTFNIWKYPDTNDLCTAILHPLRNCQPTAHLYRRSSILDAKWDPNVNVRQDFDWFFNLCATKELKWIKIPDFVGVWQHHWGGRISSSEKFNEIRKNTVPMIMKLYNKLKNDGRLNKERNNAVALALWGCVQAGFFLQPDYWSKVAYMARQIDPNARPIQEFYNYPLIKRFDPLLIQWAMMPKRLVFFYFRQLFNKLKIRHHW